MLQKCIFCITTVDHKTTFNFYLMNDLGILIKHHCCKPWMQNHNESQLFIFPEFLLLIIVWLIFPITVFILISYCNTYFDFLYNLVVFDGVIAASCPWFCSNNVPFILFKNKLNSKNVSQIAPLVKVLQFRAYVMFLTWF